MKKSLLSTLILAFFSIGMSSCEQSSDIIQQQQQEAILMESTSSIGMPSIKNFRERRLMKDIIELRDQDGLVTYTYLVSEMTGKIGQLVCISIGYGLPVATQFTNPQKFARDGSNSSGVLPQADPNGLFSPSSAEGTWVMCKDPTGDTVKPVYIEPRVIVSPFPFQPTP